MEKWEQSGWAKKLAARQVRKVSREFSLWLRYPSVSQRAHQRAAVVCCFP